MVRGMGKEVKTDEEVDGIEDGSSAAGVRAPPSAGVAETETEVALFFCTPPSKTIRSFSSRFCFFLAIFAASFAAFFS